MYHIGRRTENIDVDVLHSLCLGLDTVEELLIAVSEVFALSLFIGAGLGR